MEFAIGALALFVTLLIVPAFGLAFAFTAVIPLAGIGIVGNMFTHWKQRREARHAAVSMVRDQPARDEVNRVA